MQYVSSDGIRNELDFDCSVMIEPVALDDSSPVAGWDDHSRYLCQQGARYDRSSCLSVCPPVCEQDYCKSNEPISLKLGATIGPNNREN